MVLSILSVSLAYFALIKLPDMYINSRFNLDGRYGKFALSMKRVGTGYEKLPESGDGMAAG
jgi:hypothetical protein